jgi:hypothetical protein
MPNREQDPIQPDDFSRARINEKNEESINALIQKLRTLKVSQIRRQLKYDIEHNIERYFSVTEFIQLAKEKQS